MSETNQDQENPEPRKSSRKRRQSRRWLLWTGIPLVAVASAFAARAVAHGGCRGHHHGRTPDKMQAHMTRVVERVLSRLDATDEQRAAAKQIIANSAKDLYAVHAEGRELRRELIDAARQNDPDRVEVLRKRGIAVVDRGSALWIGGMQQLGDVLTTEQRAELFEHLDHFRGHGGWTH